MNKAIILTKPKRLGGSLKVGTFQRFRLTAEKIGYHFHYPTKVFQEGGILLPRGEKHIKDALRNRNPYYVYLSEDRQDLLVERIKSLQKLRGYISSKAQEIMPTAKIVSLYAYGSYLYAPKEYTPDDVDIGVVVEGSTYTYIPKIPLPHSFSHILNTPVQYLSLNFFGRDNFEKGFVVGEKAGYMDTEIKQEASIGYWRNVVIRGRDFLPSEYGVQNAFSSKVEMLIRCYLRFLGWGRYGKESDKERLSKLASRLYSLNVFLKLFHPEATVDLERASMLPVLAQQSKFSFREARLWYETVVARYNALEEDLSPHCSTHERNRSKNTKY